jgi:hypothetical protein
MRGRRPKELTMSLFAPSEIAAPRAGWIALMAASSLAFSLAFACAAPLAALAALAALRFGLRAGALAVLGAWVANQAAGYGLLGYPMEASSFAWGGALGLAALAAFAAARFARDRANSMIAAHAAFAAALCADQIALYAASFLLPTGPEAFSAATISYVAQINGLAFALFLCLQAAGERLGLAARAPIAARA